ncbi:MAG: hypothetical protein MPEBLZ_03141 [Candidatus Methanoperedens nitroreducens]|uniref:Uncharacterized protein n=1 Tax=Candidatus Methanoperedens nitratireducens TaxID=1392998 RepID=A0A0P8C6F1_9EURY|nr:MAG: hypothetical protein MPEBLZ_03141 [Candidatus Methanoperedens sp. BLZ1]
MNPIIIAGLGAKVVDVLMPYVKKGTEKLAKEVSIAAVEKVEGMLKTLKTRLRGDKTAEDMLDEFEKDPDTYGPVLEKIIQKKIDQDISLATELDKQLKEIPVMYFTTEVEEVEESGKVKTLEAGEITEGKITAETKVKRVKGEVTTAKIDRIGGR